MFFPLIPFLIVHKKAFAFFKKKKTIAEAGYYVGIFMQLSTRKDDFLACLQGYIL